MRNKSFLRVQIASDVQAFINSGKTITKLPSRNAPRRRTSVDNPLAEVVKPQVDMKYLPTNLKIKFGIK